MENYNPVKPIIIPFPVDSNAETNKLLLEKIKELGKEIAGLREEKDKQKCRVKKEPIYTEYSPLKKDGKQKARATDSIRSYSEFKRLQDYFMDRGKIRDWALWTVGVCLGVRISDLTALKLGHILNRDLSFKQRITIREQKTGKINNCLITEAIIIALTKYFNTLKWEFCPNDYVFRSQKKGKMTGQHAWKIISDAGKTLMLDIIVGSHTMRKSFINIATCVRKYTIDMGAITIAQSHLQHANQQTTMRYMGVLDEIKDEDRIAVSDFVLGRSKINKLVDGLIKGNQK